MCGNHALPYERPLCLAIEILNVIIRCKLQDWIVFFWPGPKLPSLILASLIIKLIILKKISGFAMKRDVIIKDEPEGNGFTM